MVDQVYRLAVIKQAKKQKIKVLPKKKVLHILKKVEKKKLVFF